MSGLDDEPFAENARHMPLGEEGSARLDLVQEPFDNVALALGIGRLQQTGIAQEPLECTGHLGARLDNRLIGIQTCRKEKNKQ